MEITTRGPDETLIAGSVPIGCFDNPTYSKQTYEELKEWADSINKSAVTMPVSLKAMELRNTGLSELGLGFDWQTLRQVCGRIAKGLHTLLEDLSLQLMSDSYKCGNQQEAAIRIYNSILRRRLPVFSSNKLLVDRSSGLIFGMVGRVYERLSIKSGIQMLEEMTNTAGCQLSLRQGVVFGRECLLVYRLKNRTIRSVSKQHRFHQGLVMLISEIPGNSIKFSHAWLDQDTGAIMIDKRNAAAKINHVSRTYRAKFWKAVRQSVKPNLSRTNLKEAIERRESGFWGFGINGEEVKREGSRQAKRLRHMGAKAHVANQLIAMVIHKSRPEMQGESLDKQIGCTYDVALDICQQVANDLTLNDRLPVYRFSWDRVFKGES